jgi:tetratricopeptide (TPR) repeat protein
MRAMLSVGVLLGALILGPAHPALAGDSVVAKTLFTEGKKAFNARKYEDAATLFKKAASEDPFLIEAVSWRAQALEKCKDTAGALAAYREYISLAERKKGSGGLSPEEDRLRGAAEKRVEALAQSEKEFRALEEKYVADLLAVAKARLAKGEPAAALKAADRVLEILPRQEEALALHRRLSEESPNGPFAAVFEWKDLLADRSFQSNSVSYTEGKLTLDATIGGKLRPTPGVSFGSDFGYEAEFRIATAYDPAWTAGLSFGDTSEGYYGLIAYRTKLDLAYGKPPANPTILGSVATEEVAVEAWHRIGVLTRGNVIEGWLDGRKCIESTLKGRTDAAGEIGISMTCCRVEWRLIRAGRIK